MYAKSNQAFSVSWAAYGGHYTQGAVWPTQRSQGDCFVPFRQANACERVRAFLKERSVSRTGVCAIAKDMNETRNKDFLNVVNNILF